ncbi:agmatinase family protein [Bradyrhizobium sp. Cp5.3]|uniref:agmatinase family protein n=1 Tax=Bradyrhizobium sp. Cp5.3 TaxID=443598 RepID=UPI000480ABCE|nr:agmatinase family protein [Bradyrhizobium sp. Cp5.3]
MSVSREQLPVVVDATVPWIRDRWTNDMREIRDEAAFAFISVPFDYAVSHRPGCRFGPEKILQALDSSTTYCVDKRVSLSEATFVRYEPIDVVHSLDQTYRNIREAVASLPGRVRPIILGGDHSISDPAIRGVVDRLGGGKLGLVVLDAHFDMRPPVSGKEHSGHWMRTISDVIDYHKVAQLGINAPIYSEEYMRLAETSGTLVLTPYDIRKMGWPDAICAVLRHVSEGVDGVYLSVDIDAVDQAHAPGTSVPNPGGLLTYEVLDVVFEIAARAHVLALDITEVSPPLDRDDMTSKLAAQIVLNVMAGVVSRETKRPTEGC